MADDTRMGRAPAKGNDSLIACADDCFSMISLRSCIEDERRRGTVRGQLHLARARGEAEEGRMPPDVMLAVRKAIDKIEFCADRYADIEASEFDEAGYGVCAWGAAYVYLRQTGWGDALSAAEEGHEAKVAGDITALATGLELVVQVAEATQRAAIASVAASASRSFATPAQDQAKLTSQECVEDLDDNREFCSERYPNDSNGETQCFKAADTALGHCLKKISVAQ